MTKVGILRFLGSNCDRDVEKALKSLKVPSEFLWGRDNFSPQDFSAFILPGGFSYGDHLRAGALASLAPSLRCLKKASQQGKPILGICNGFQILCESGLLEGTLLTNESGEFIDDWVDLRLENGCALWGGLDLKDNKLPIAHKQGRYFGTKDILKKLQDEGRIWLSYKKNPNGSLKNIAGIFNKNKNVAGLMPHPERACFSWADQKQDGIAYFKHLLRLCL